MSYESTGQIKTMRLVDERYNLYEYTIHDIHNKTTSSYKYWGNNPGNNPLGLNNLFEVTVTYDQESKNGYTNNVIKSVKYGDYVTDMTAITDLLLKKIKFTKCFAKKITDEFGSDTIKVLLTEPDKLKKIKYTKSADELKKFDVFIADQNQSAVSLFLSANSVKAKYHQSVINNFSLDELKLALYDMFFKCGVPFDVCDKMALKHGYDHSDQNRIGAFITHLYKERNQCGELYLSRNRISRESGRHAQMPLDLVLKHLIQIENDGTLYYTLPEIYEKEKQIEKMCNTLRKDVRSISYDQEFENYTEFDVEGDIDEHQQYAINSAIHHNINIITGRPGTGKTFVISQVCQIITRKHVLVYILAPTGAAVERIRSSKYIQKLSVPNIHIKTIHSFINLHKRSEGLRGCDDCGGNSKTLCECVDQPIGLVANKYEEIIFFIDEMSMVGLSLFYKFMSIINSQSHKSRLILLGDPNQLPSIDGGNVLRDMIMYSKIKCTELKNQHRQNIKDDKSNPIGENAERVINGEDLVFDGRTIKFIETTYNDIYKTLIRTLKKEKIKFQNSAVITPQRIKGICTNVMNQYLQIYYNRNGEIIPKFKTSTTGKIITVPNIDDGAIRVGDKVIQTINDWKREIFNGSILIVDKILDDGISCKYYKDDNKLGSTDFEPRIYHMNKINDLSLAYAITIHKAQGKGYDNVIIVIHSSMKRMLNINLLYTAITRTKEKCIIIGDKSALSECKKAMILRVTNLFKNNMIMKNEKTMNNTKKIITI